MSVKKSFISVFTISYSIFENRKQSDFLVIKSGKKKRNIFLKLTALAFTQKHKTFWSRYLFFKKIGKEGYLWKLSHNDLFPLLFAIKRGWITKAQHIPLLFFMNSLMWVVPTVWSPVRATTDQQRKWELPDAVYNTGTGPLVAKNDGNDNNDGV